MSREMKDSGIDCIGQIPSDWGLMRFKFCLAEQLKYGANESGVEYQPDLPRYIRITDINSDGTLKEEGKLSLNEEQADGFLLKDGDILFARSGATVGKSFLYKSGYGNSAFAGYLIKASVNKIVIPEFVNYITQSSYYDIWKDQIFTQATIQNISAEKYNQLPIVIPSKEEQQHIVNFLNKKTDAINSIIQKQKDIVDKLMEYKQSTITQAVTKGLNPNVEMKEVSMDFTNSIPQNWECSRLKYHCKITNGADPKTEGNIPVYGSGSEIVKYCGEFKNGPAILIGRKGTLDKPKLIEGKYWNVDTAMDLHPYSHVNPKYLYYVISCFTIDKYSTCTAKPSMTQGDYYNILVPVPSVLEQNEIVEYIDSKCDSIDESIERSNKIIQKLEEYKKALVYNAVTGKIDCRGEVK